MSRYVIYYSCGKAMYRELAIRWIKWSKTTKLPEDQIKGISLFFKSIARRFGLITEFRELGIIN